MGMTGGAVKGSCFFHKKENPLKISRFLKCLAEREGFEPPVPLGTVVFKTTVIDHSTISPVLDCLKSGCKGTDILRTEQIFRQLFIKYLVFCPICTTFAA